MTEASRVVYDGAGKPYRLTVYSDAQVEPDELGRFIGGVEVWTLPEDAPTQRVRVEPSEEWRDFEVLADPENPGEEVER